MKPNNRNFKSNKNFKGGYFNNKPKFDRPKPVGLQVFVREGEDPMKAYRKLKKRLMQDGILQEVKDRRYYQKPSEKKKLAKQQAKRRNEKRQRELAMEYGIRYKNYTPGY